MRVKTYRLLVGAAVLTLAVALLAPGTSQPTAAAAGVSAAAPGALFGLFPGGNDPVYPLADAFYVTNNLTPPLFGAAGQSAGSYLPDLVDWQGRGNDVINIYDGWEQITDPDPELFDYQLPAIWDTYHAIPLISWASVGNEENVITDQNVAAGDYDAYLKAWALQLHQFIDGVDGNGNPAPLGGRRVYIRFDWEANGSWYPYSPTVNDGTCAQLASNEAAFVGMWRHVYDVVMTAGGFTRDQVAWVFNINAGGSYVPPNCPGGASNVVAAMYPGDAYVDWVGIDGYAVGDYTSPGTIFGPWINDLRAITSRPLAINEVGDGTQSQPSEAPVQANNVYAIPQQKGQWISQYFSYLEQAGVKMSLWFNDDKEQDWAIFSQPDPLDPFSRGDCTYTAGSTVYNAYCEYRAGIDSPYFTSTQPSNPRLLSDAEFLGDYSTVSLTPTSGLPESKVTIDGVGFAADSPVTATFAGQPLALSTSRTDSSGMLTATFTVPAKPPARYQVTLTDSGGDAAAATFTIGP
jgi:mannan endo-1,4-beta-mannosidase